jgi:hypothetical protein
MPEEVLAVRMIVPASARTLMRFSSLGAGRTVREFDMGNLDNLLDLLGCQLALPLHRKLGRTKKPDTMGALERDEFLRAAWRVVVAEQVETERLVFVDEMGTNASLSPLYAWAKKGQRARWSVPRNRGANTTVLSCMSAGGMGPSLTVEGTTTSAVFEAYVEQVLAPTLGKGQVVVMGNLSAHKGERIRQLIEERGCELLYFCRPALRISTR